MLLKGEYTFQRAASYKLPVALIKNFAKSLKNVGKQNM